MLVQRVRFFCGREWKWNIFDLLTLILALAEQLQSLQCRMTGVNPVAHGDSDDIGLATCLLVPSACLLHEVFLILVGAAGSAHTPSCLGAPL